MFTSLTPFMKDKDKTLKNQFFSFLEWEGASYINGVV